MTKTHDPHEGLLFGYAIMGVVIWAELASAPFRVTSAVLMPHSAIKRGQ